MRIKLNLWQTISLFLPFIAGEVLLRLSFSGGTSHRVYFAIANLLTTLNVALAIAYQAQLGINFNKSSEPKFILFKANALIPVVFTACYFLYATWGTIIARSYNSANYNTGPLRRTQLHGSALIILLFLLHAFITFYFINNQFVSRKIKLIVDEGRRKELTSSFLMPMKLLTRVSIYVIGSSLLISMFIDMLTFAKLNK